MTQLQLKAKPPLIKAPSDDADGATVTVVAVPAERAAGSTASTEVDRYGTATRAIGDSRYARPCMRVTVPKCCDSCC